MAHNHPLSTPFATNPIDGDGLDDALVERVALTFDDVADIQALDLTGKATSHIIFGTSVYTYDASDTTTAHNGSTVLVTNDGKRFKNDGVRVGFAGVWAVDDDDTSSPPATPASGDAYLLPASPSGAWSAYGKHIAIWSNGAWVYIAPRLGMLVYVDDEDAYFRYNGSAWVAGLGSTSIAAGAIKASQLEQAYGWWVEEETATPPSIPSAGVQYIVGTSATGAWSGEDGNIARSTGAAWEFVTAAEGMTVFNKDLGYQVAYKSGSWQVDRPSGILLHASRRIVNTSATQINTTYAEYLSFGSYSVETANNVIRVRGNVSGSSASTSCAIQIGLFFNTETLPRQSYTSAIAPNDQSYMSIPFELEYVVPDTSARNVYIKIRTTFSGINIAAGSIYGYLEELAAN